MIKYLTPISINNRFSKDFQSKLAMVEELGGYIAGGYARACSGLFEENHPASRFADIDFFLEDDANYPEIFNLFKDWYDYYDTHSYNDAVVDCFKHMERKIQLVNNQFMPPKNQVAKFDLSVCKAYIWNKEVHVTPECYDDCFSLNMRYTSKKRIKTHEQLTYLIHRLGKYLGKGFFISPEELLKVYHLISERESRDRFAYHMESYKHQIRDFNKFEVIIRLNRL